MAWIQIFILTVSECIAPAGKTVCQEREYELQFVNQADCETALRQLLALKSESEKVIVNVERSRCVPSARRQDIFASADAINSANTDTTGWRAPAIEQSESAPTEEAHQQRLADMKSCEETRGAAPCKIGEVIIEGAGGKSVDVWRKDR